MKTRVCFITALFMTFMALTGGAYAGEAAQSDSDNGAEAILWAYMLAEPDAAAILQSGPIQEGLVTWMLMTSSDTANACLTEALARKLGLPATDSFSDAEESAIMIAKMEALTKEQLRVLQGLHLYIKEVVANRKQQAGDADTPKADTGESQLTSEQAADFANAFRDQGLTTTSISDETTGAPETISAAANEQESRSEEEIAELSDFLMSRFSQYDEVQLQELQSWFLALPAADHAAIVRYLVKQFSSTDSDAFFSWYEVALTSCSGSTNAGADSLRIPGGKTWADLTFAGFPAPSQGAISRTTKMKIGNGTVHQVVLENVKQETVDAWKEQIMAAGGCGAEQQTPDFGDGFYQQIGTHFTTGKETVMSLSGADGEPMQEYYAVDGGSSVEIVYYGNTLVVTTVTP